ncbi:hypothetical protein F2Q70_00029779 [Brassica cretica]|uniref:Uncharacterized protein n=1 Tax=Brassica cretica TaxID=69181 RepID=A0A8S9FBS6_BRACR|nr:hypothetical protein F2Q70_00029779 [Brassica cretica]
MAPPYKKVILIFIWATLVNEHLKSAKVDTRVLGEPIGLDLYCLWPILDPNDSLGIKIEPQREQHHDSGLFYLKLHKCVGCLTIDGDLPTVRLSPSFDSFFDFRIASTVADSVELKASRMCQGALKASRTKARTALFNDEVAEKELTCLKEEAAANSLREKELAVKKARRAYQKRKREVADIGKDRYTEFSNKFGELSKKYTSIGDYRECRGAVGSLCMPSSTRSNKEKHLLFSEDPSHLERTIRKDQCSTSLDAAAFTSTDSRTHPSTDARPSSLTDPHRSTSIDSTPRTSIDPQSRSMVAIVILRQDENGDLYMPSSTRSNKETHLLFSEDPAYSEHSIRKDQRSTSLDAAAFTSTDSLTHPSTNTRPSSSTDLHRSTSIVSTLRTLIDHQSRSVVAIVILRQDENENLYDQDVHLSNATS